MQASSCFEPFLQRVVFRAYQKKAAVPKVPPDKKTSWGKRERYSFGYAVFLILALMK